MREPQRGRRVIPGLNGDIQRQFLSFGKMVVQVADGFKDLVPVWLPAYKLSDELLLCLLDNRTFFGVKSLLATPALTLYNARILKSSGKR